MFLFKKLVLNSKFSYFESESGLKESINLSVLIFFNYKYKVGQTNKQ